MVPSPAGPHPGASLIRIGVFYEGTFFHYVSNYYRYAHPHRARLSIPGLHEFVRHQVATEEDTDIKFCRIVDARFFRGRLFAREAEATQKLYSDRVLDDILMSEGVITHYLPVRGRLERGLDVYFALEAYELALHKKFDVAVLIAGDSDFVPLVRKLNTLGCRVMVLGWQFKQTDESGAIRETVTSAHLLEAATYPVLMHALIDDPVRQQDAVLRNLFIEPKSPATTGHPRSGHGEPPTPAPSPAHGTPFEGVICNLKEGYGFIRTKEFSNNVFFYWEELTNRDFDALNVGDDVRFLCHQGEKGPVATKVDVMID
jgi:cold shock CspA family protein/uncharacterized LabA/DUF88 family protein